MSANRMLKVRLFHLSSCDSYICSHNKDYPGARHHRRLLNQAWLLAVERHSVLLLAQFLLGASLDVVDNVVVFERI